jgi:hypothetical protein
MSEAFDPKTHRATYENIQDRVEAVEEKISGDKSVEELEALIAEKKVLLTELEIARGDAPVYANTENADLDTINREIEELQIKLKEAEVRKSEIISEVPPDKIDRALRDLGSPAVFDRSIEDGTLSFSIDDITADKLRTPDGAKQAFIEADSGSATNPWDGFFDTRVDAWEPLTKTTFDTCIISHGQTTQAERAQLVTHMESLGYRPPTRTELLALAITRPDLNKIPHRYLTTLKEYSLGGVLLAPCFALDDSGRGLGADGGSGVWDDRDRFLFVRK